MATVNLCPYHWHSSNTALSSVSYLATLLWRKDDEGSFSPKLRVRIKDNNNSPHGKFHRFLFPFSSKFSDLKFASYVLYKLPVLCHVSHTVSLGYLWFYNSVDDRVTYASAPKWDGCEHVLSSSRWMWSKCRWRINSYPPALQTWEVGVFWSPLLPHKSCLVLALALSTTFSCHWLAACERDPHETTTISPRVQVQFSFGTIYNIKQELSNKWAEFES